jgi:predicted Zn-dependent protease
MKITCSLLSLLCWLAASLPAAEPPKSKDPLGELFNLGRSLVKTADDVGQEVLGLTTEEENQVGRDVSEIVRRRHPIYTDKAVEERIQKLARPLLALSQRKGITFRFALVDSPVTNACSTLGGYVFINRGLLNFARSDAELQCVIGHEIAHVELRHCARQLTYAIRAQQVGEAADKSAGKLAGNVTQIAYSLLSVGHSKEQEFAADEWAYKAMRQIGRTKTEATSMARLFAAQARERGEPRRSDAGIAKIAAALDRHFQTHPPPGERLQRLERLD